MNRFLVLTALLLGFTTAASAGWVWSVATLSQNRQSLAATSIRDLALFAGGDQGYPPFLDTVDIFNSTSMGWTTASLSVGRTLLSATSVADVALFAGGTDSAGASRAVDLFNVTSRNWTTATLSRGRNWASATSVGDVALFAGGLYNYGPASDVVDIFNATSGNWTTASLSVARYSLSATRVGDVALFAGGLYDNGTASDLVDIFNATNGTWTTATLSQARHLFWSITWVGDLAIVAGGNSDTQGIAAAPNPLGASKVVDIFNATSGNWTTASLSRARYDLSATSVAAAALFAGGWDSTGTASNVVDMFNATDASWETTSLSVARSGGAATSIPGVAALFGGGALNSGALSAAVDVYHFVPESPSPSPLPSVLPIVRNVTSDFSGTMPAVNLSAPRGSSTIGLGIKFDRVAAAGVSSDGVYTVTNDTGGAGNATTAFAYLSSLVHANSNASLGSIHQDFSFSTASRQVSLYRDSVTLAVPPAVVKWSVGINVSVPFSGLNLTFSLSDLYTSATATNASLRSVPSNDSGIPATVYYLPLSRRQKLNPVAVMEVLDWALVDGVLVAISHSVLALDDNGTSYALTLQFPAFNESVEYDPSLGLGKLVGGSRSGSDGGPDLGLVIGAAAGVSIAIVLVGLVVTAAIVAGVILARRRQAELCAVNFDVSRDDEAHQL